MKLRIATLLLMTCIAVSAQYLAHRRQAFQVASSGTIVPTDISGLKAWWKADYYSLSDDTTISAVWATSGGDARNATVSGSPKFRTAIQNGLPIVRITNSTLDYFSFTTADISAFTVFIAHKSFNSGSGYAGPLNWRTASENGFQLVNDANSATWVAHLVVWNGTSETANHKADSVAFPTAFRIESWTSGGNFERDGSNVSTTSGVSGFGSAGGRIGSGYSFCSADIGEIIVYDTVLSAGDRAAITDYLQSRWGL